MGGLFYGLQDTQLIDRELVGFTERYRQRRYGAPNQNGLPDARVFIVRSVVFTLLPPVVPL